MFPPKWLGAERVLARDHAGHLGAEVVLKAHHRGLTSWSGTTAEPKGAKSEQKSSISTVMTQSTENLNIAQCTNERRTNEPPDIDLKVEGDIVRKLRLPQLQLLLEEQVHELKGMIMFIHATMQDNTVLVQISQAGKSHGTRSTPAHFYMRVHGTTLFRFLNYHDTGTPISSHAMFCGDSWLIWWACLRVG